MHVSEQTRPVLVVAGARPNFIKVAPILRELDRRGISRLFVHTGQHYDVKMSEALLADLEAPKPDVLLEVGSASHAIQTARVMERFEPVLLQHRPSWVVVVGDVNSTLACALVTAKLRPELGCRLAHVEAGLRSNDWAMPEEVNRVLTDRLSDLLLTPSEDVVRNIEREGLADTCVTFVGNVMIDSLLSTLPAAQRLDMPSKLGLTGRAFALATLHRPSNVDDFARLAVILEALHRIAREMPVVFPIHPRTRARIRDASLEALLEGVVVTEPLGYVEMLSMLNGASVAVTDSGGIQEETTVLGVPCVTVRASTERPVTVIQGTNAMIPWPPSVSGIQDTVMRSLARGRFALGTLAPTGWDGRTANRIVDALCTET
jgi:UDP-N-acetylglucosamine 2-epimerase (non-hydrolysing)